jgi:hypothetical protein
VPQTKTNEMPTVVDVDEIHKLKYEQTTMHVEEEKEPAQEPKQSIEDIKRMESDAFKGKGMQQEEPAMGSTQHGLELELEHETKQEVVPEGGVSSYKGIKRHEQRVVCRAYNAYRCN